MLTKIPAGLDEIIATFGSLNDPHFEIHNLVSFDLPYPLTYGARGVAVTKARAHRLAVDHFIQAYRNIKAAGMTSRFTEFNGIYAHRDIRGQGGHPSTHSWGIAVDMCASLYPLGSLKRMPDAIINAMRVAGFFYGGDFHARKDPMHFQLATHY